MIDFSRVPFRLGTTSYIIPDDILPNVRYLADKVQDVELVLFEIDEGPSNLPSPEEVTELERLANDHDLTYTIHLPLDIGLGVDRDEGHVSLVKARKVIECTRSLETWAYVLHLEGRAVRSPDTPREVKKKWQADTVRALEIVAGWADGPGNLAVENLEGYPLDFFKPILSCVPASRCVDIGHLWLDSHDPVPYLKEALPRTRVVHLHGLADRDHKSLAHMPVEQLIPVLTTLMDVKYAGVLTLEIFGEADFYSSMEALAKGLGKLQEV